MVVNPSFSGGLPTSYNVTISNSSYMYGCRISTPAFLNGSAMVTFTGLTNSTSYTISSTVLVQVTLPESMSYVSIHVSVVLHKDKPLSST